MAEEELVVVKIRDDYYRDCFDKVVLVLGSLLVIMGLLAAIILYNLFNKPLPTTFRVSSEMRVLAPVPLENPYISNVDLLQWVSEVLPSIFNLDFLHWDDQVAVSQQYFSASAYQIFLNQLANYASKEMLESGKMFSNAVPTGAPVILNQQVQSGRYAWRIQMPISVEYQGLNPKRPVMLTIQILVVRTETATNLRGILIDNITVTQGGGDKSV